MAAELSIRWAQGHTDLEVARSLFVEYSEELGIDLSFQDFDAEVASLPGDYTPPHGRLLLAELEGVPVGCVAMRRWSEGVAEMKRLFVSPPGRGVAAGRALAEAVIAEARTAGYRSMRLDTLPSMDAARSLYASLGFVEIAAYRPNPIAGTSFLELEL